jgi:subtilase family serine protease
MNKITEEVKKNIKAYCSILPMSMSMPMPMPMPMPIPMSTHINQLFNVSQIYNLYGFNKLPYKALVNGPNLNIVIVISYSYPNIQNDLDMFCSINNIPSCKLNIVKMDPNIVSSDSWSTEICLDTQWIHAICPYANITIVEAVSNSLEDLVNAVQKANSLNPKPHIINMSWGASEFKGCNSINIFDPKILYVASSGDSNDVCWPSSNPNILSVSATTLNTNSSGTEFVSESTWSSSGCGPSQYFKIPVYQKNNIKSVKNVENNNNYRMVSDICMDGNPNSGVFIYCKGKYFGVGGTSLSAPLVAGIMGIIDYQRLLQNKSVFNSSSDPNNALSIQNILYNIYGQNINNIYNLLFYDVTSGKTGDYSAKLGYDYPTGLGSPFVPNFVPYLIKNDGTLPTLEVKISTNTTIKYINKDNSTGNETSETTISATSNDLNEKDVLENKLIHHLEQIIIPNHFSKLIDKEKIEKYDFEHQHSISFDFI